MPSLKLVGQSNSLNLNCCQNLRLRQDLPIFKPFSVKEFEYTEEFFLTFKHSRRTSLLNFVWSFHSPWDSRTSKAMLALQDFALQMVPEFSFCCLCFLDVSFFFFFFLFSHLCNVTSPYGLICHVHEIPMSWLFSTVLINSWYVTGDS